MCAVFSFLLHFEPFVCSPHPNNGPDLSHHPLFLNYPLQVTGLDTGSGEVVFEEPITVGWVVQDREGVVCDDTCEFAFDGGVNKQRVRNVRGKRILHTLLEME